jgi:hypothetical protein
VEKIIIVYKYHYKTPGSDMIYTIKDTQDPYAGYLKDDPVRPHIPNEQRFGSNRAVLALTDDNHVQAVVCTRLCSLIPTSEEELLMDNSADPDTAVFYTIWSYTPGAGQQLIREGLAKLQQENPNIKRFVTLSPPTEMAKRFHLKNGARIFRVNDTTVNYEYISI